MDRVVIYLCACAVGEFFTTAVAVAGFGCLTTAAAVAVIGCDVYKN